MYRLVRQIIGKVDLLFIGMECVGAPMSWLYGPLFTENIPKDINESRRFNGSNFMSAKKIVDIFDPNEVNIYALGLESWYRYFMGLSYTENSEQLVESDKLIKYCNQSNISARRLFKKHEWIF